MVINGIKGKQNMFDIVVREKKKYPMSGSAVSDYHRLTTQYTRTYKHFKPQVSNI